MFTEQQQKKPLTSIEKARAVTAMNLFFAGKLTDEFLPPEEYAIFIAKPFPEWPKELQEKLVPFGGAMVR